MFHMENDNEKTEELEKEYPRVRLVLSVFDRLQRDSDKTAPRWKKQGLSEMEICITEQGTQQKGNCLPHCG